LSINLTKGIGKTKEGGTAIMKDLNYRPCLTRRDFLAGTAALAGMALLPHSLLAVTPEPMPTLKGYNPKVTGYWVAKGEHEKSYILFKKMVEATTDFKWLSRGTASF
jgi:hypothetical protein